jgi:MATE family, multidrug efflux pump
MILDNKAQAQRLGTDNLLSLIISISVPAICGNVTIALYNIISRLFVGNYVSTHALGAIGLIYPLNNITAALSVMTTIGGGAMISLSLGKQEYDKTNVVFTNIIAWAIGSSAILTCIFFFFAEPLVRLCGADQTSMLYEMAVNYLRITAIGQVFQILNLTLAAIIRAEGNTRYSMFVSMIGSFVNIGLVSVFILICHWGINGAAVATVISQFIGMFYSILYFVHKKSITRWVGWKYVELVKMLKIVSMGLAPAILQGLSFFTNLIISNSLMIYATAELGAGGGDLAISAISVISTVESVAIMVILGLNNGIATIISYNYGLERYDRVKSTAIIGQIIALLISLSIWGVMMFMPKALFSIFSNGNLELIEYGTGAIRKSRMFLMFLGFQTLASMYYSAIGNPKMATLISISRNGLFLIPALLILPKLMGLDGVLYSTAVSDGCSMIFVSIIYLKGIFELDKRIHT